MGGLGCVIEKVKQRSCGTLDAGWQDAILGWEADDETKEDATDVLVLLARDARELGDTLGEVAEGVVLGEAAASRVHLSCAIRLLQPRDEVLYDALI